MPASTACSQIWEATGTDRDRAVAYSYGPIMLWLAAASGFVVPTPAECDDPIAGTWVGIEKRPRGWLHYTVQIQRTASTGLEGRILGHVWHDHARTPPPCVGRHEEYVAHQPATGTFVDGAVTFHALDVTRIESRCGSGHRYLPDGLNGTLSGPSQMDVISDDGGAPPSRVVLTRTECAPHDRPGT